MSAILKYCPFCGENEVEMEGPGHGVFPNYFAQCLTCTTRGPNGADRESAELQWNTRHAPNVSEIKLPRRRVMRCLGTDCDVQFLTTPDSRLCPKCSGRAAMVSDISVRDPG